MSDTSILAALAAPATVVLAAALKGALLIALAFVATHLLRHRSAATRHAIWAAAILGHLALVAVLPLTPRVQLPIIPSMQWGAAAEQPTAFRVETASEPVPLAAESGAPSVSDPGAANATISPVSQDTRLPSPLALLIAGWLFGAVIVFARYVVGTVRVARLARRSERVADGNWLSLVSRMAIGMGIARPLTLVRGEQLDVPVTWGILYPVVFLPADSAEWAEERQRFVLVHELAHVKRLDAVTQLLTQITVALFWFDPLVWYAAKRIRAERERACDDQVLLHGVRPTLYADELLQMVRNMVPRRADPAPAFAALAMARRSEFEGRMLAILDPAAPRGTLSRRATLAMFTAALLLLGPLAAIQPVTVPVGSVTSAAPDEVGRAGSGSDVEAASRKVGESSVPQQLPPESQTGAPDNPATTADGTVASASPAVAAAGSTADKPMYRCTQADLAYTGNQVSVHKHGADDPAASYTEAIMKSRGHCTYALLIGNVTLANDLTDVANIPSGGRAFFHELTTRSNRALTITRGATGVLERQYLEDGQPTDPSRGGKWLGDLLRTLVMKGGLGAEQRVAQLRASGGVAAVLDEAANVLSSGVKAAYYTHLLRMTPRLTQPEADRLLRDAGAGIESSGDLARVARAAQRDASPSPAAIEFVLGRIQSDGDRSSVMRQSLSNSDPEVTRAVLRVAVKIESDGDKASVLTSAARIGLATEASRNDFYAVVATITSDGSKASVLTSAVRHTPRDGVAVRQLLAAAKGIESDGDKASVLHAVINARLLVDAPTREAFMETARTISSDGDLSRVMTALLR